MNKNALFGLIAGVIVIAAAVFYFSQGKSVNVEPPQSLVSTVIESDKESNQEVVKDSVQKEVSVQGEEQQETKPEKQQAATAQPVPEPVNEQKPSSPKPLAPKTEPTVTQREEQVQTPKTFTLIPAQSSASFQLNELLFGSPKTVIGTTSSVKGEVVVDWKAPSQSSVKNMAIDARTFVTDDNNRDNHIRTSILKAQTAPNEYITFSSRSVNGLGAELKNGTNYPVVIKGNLTIAGVTREAVFNGSFSLKDDSTMNGTASAMVKRSDYGITIPSLSFIANVDEEVKLSFSFTAAAQ